MSHAWNQSIEIDAAKAKALIESQHAIVVDDIQVLDEGWDNVVYLVNENLIFRFPRRAFGVDCMDNEIALLPYIASHVSFPLSAPLWIGKPCKDYPYPFAGYPMIPGRPVADVCPSLIDDRTFATNLALWLAELHAVPVISEHKALVKGKQPGWQYDVPHRIKRCQENLAQYEHYFLSLGFEKTLLLDIMALLPLLRFNLGQEAYLHGDLYSRHVMMDPENQHLSGLIDWGDIHIGHPGIDLAVGMIFTAEMFQIFLKVYGRVDEGTLNLSMLHAFCHHMSFLPYACEQNRSHLKHWAAMVLMRSIEEIKARGV